MTWDLFGKIVLLMMLLWLMIPTPGAIFRAYFAAKLADEKKRMADR